MRICTLMLCLAACTEPPRVPALLCPESLQLEVYADEDGDGFGAGPGRTLCEIELGGVLNDDDCDDTREDVNPDMLEVCDGVDQDCDGEIDDGVLEVLWYPDEDGDGFGSGAGSVLACSQPDGHVLNAADCDDSNPALAPDIPEVCDERDNDCDGLVDDDDPGLFGHIPVWYADADGDGYGDPAGAVEACLQPGGVVDNDDDCDDTSSEIRPGAGEVCDAVDNDCDGRFDESDSDLDPGELSTWYADSDGDGLGDPDEPRTACTQPWFTVENSDDCDDGEPLLGFPAPWVADGDGDGVGAGSASAPSCVPPAPGWVLLARGLDCDDADPSVFPGNPEVCDAGVDNDCDGLSDDADPDLVGTSGQLWYADGDRDTYGDRLSSAWACTAPLGRVGNRLDCDDTRADVNPDATEVCNGGRDDDCDGRRDDDDASLDLSTAAPWFADVDGDGYGDDLAQVLACRRPHAHSAFGGDCDDSDPGRSPAVLEVCEDGIDQDCSGSDLGCGLPLVPDTCADLVGATPYGTGSTTIVDALDVYADDLGLPPANTCTGRATLSPDALLPVHLEPGELLRAQHTNVDDAVLYLLDACGPAASCLGGADEVGVGGREAVELHNATASPLDLVAVVECSGPGCGLAAVDLVVEPGVAWAVGDTCAEAEVAVAYTTGGTQLVGSVLGRGDDIQLAPLNPCTVRATPGEDAWLPVLLLPGEQLVARHRQSVADASLYLWRDCGDAGTCIVGADATGAGGEEELSYTNASGGNERLYLGVDCAAGGCAAFEVDVVVF